ncbi:MAG: 30S ribosomal protein S4 [Candidatus Eisenbacteria bacterium]|uniref:Small ribosomal subunit protein uS4 n=1 Tax=Eiseniibacteriota bacterium TaxID=2212470 RepID=A0A938BSF9_UNCEI|nr:30S ribosomal protein S4 [Candidatus Eisenbacteria bacterium]
MGVYHGPKCKLCRREGVRLYLKGERCYTEKCALEGHAYPPGEHGQDRRRRKDTSYGVQLREKQKAKRIYGVMERQFRNYFERAARRQGVTGEVLLQMLELRMDNTVYRLGLAASRSAARHLVGHGHFLVNGRSVDRASYLLKPGDVVSVRPESRKIAAIRENFENRRRTEDQPWLEIDEKEMTGRIAQIPSREQIPVPVQEQLIVELYSK